ncbi:MAG: hypothetical protein ACOX2N_08410 [Peptococcia bacterium]|jgi:hypothetical protein
MKNFIKELIERGHKGESDTIKHISECCEGASDLRKILMRYQEVLEKIKAKYEPYSYEYNFKEKFGEELSFDDFYASYYIIADYCKRNNVSREKLYGLRQEIEVKRDKIFDEITKEIRLAEVDALKEIAKSGGWARQKTLIEVMRKIKYNVSPYDQRPIRQENLLEEMDLDLIEEKLREKGIDNEIETEEYGWNKKIKRGWDIVVEKLGRKINKKEYQASCCQETRNMRENLLIFEEELREIKAEFEQYSFETACKEKFGVALDSDDFLDKEKIDVFCEKNKVIKEELYRFYEERNQELRYGGLSKIQKIISKKIKLAEAHVFLRDGNFFEGKQLRELIKLIQKYYYSGAVAKFTDRVQEVQVKKEKLGFGDETVRKRILTKMVNNIKSNIKPYGGEEKFSRDWISKLDSIENNLREKGIAIEDYGQDKELERSWAEVEKQLKNVKHKEHNERILDDWCRKQQLGQVTRVESVRRRTSVPEKDGR